MSDHVPTAVPLNQPRTVWLAVIGGGVALALCATVYQGSQTETLRRQMTAYQQDNDALRVKLLQSDTQLQNALGALREDLTVTKQEANTSLTKAQQAALRHADLVAGKLEEQEQAQAKQLSEELGKVKETTEQASAKLEGITTDVGSVKTDVGSVRTEVGSVRTDVDSARSNIEAAKTELQRVRGDLGLMSGLVATNGKEIRILRDLGDRNIYEFTLSKSSGLQKVGDVQVALRKTDVKRNRYTVDVLADDKRVEKKDKDANEPVQFYASGARQPYEMVINQVKKDQVVGYLATPKVTISRISANVDTAATPRQQ
jgi:chromosome segregation ATPase